MKFEYAKNGSYTTFLDKNGNVCKRFTTYIYPVGFIGKDGSKVLNCTECTKKPTTEFEEDMDSIQKNDIYGDDYIYEW